MLPGFLAEGALDDAGDGAGCFVTDAEEGGLGSVLFHRPEEAADRAYDLTTIAVRPDRQGSGRGAESMGAAEADLRQRGQRLLLVRTSGTPQYDRTREFHRRLGYREEARVAEYWPGLHLTAPRTTGAISRNTDTLLSHGHVMVVSRPDPTRGS